MFNLEVYKKLEEYVFNQYNLKEEHRISVFSKRFLQRDISICAKYIFSKIKECFVKEEIKSVYQVVLDKNFSVHSCEMLTRWKLNDVNINPMVLMYVLENGKSGAQETFLCHQFKRYIRDLKIFINSTNDQIFRLSFNISSKNLTPKFVKTVINSIKNGISPTNVRIEITENHSFSNIDMDLFMELKEVGIKIYLDDFGKNYSTIEVLKQFPFNMLKFDIGFARNLKDEAIFKLLKDTIKFCKQEKIGTVCEGVENYEDANILFAEGIDYVQGFVFSKPVEISQAIEKVNHFNNMSLNL